MSESSIIDEFSVDLEKVKENLRFLMDGEDLEVTEHFDKNGEIVGSKKKRRKSIDSVLKGLLVADIISGGRLGVARSGLVGEGSAKGLKPSKPRMLTTVDAVAISNLDSTDEE